jgi:hypothetical protein
MTFSELTSRKSLALGCGPWIWYKGLGEIHMNKGRVGEERKGKEMDRCPLTWSAVSHTARGQAVSGIYIRDHRSYYLWIVMLLA